MEEFKRRYPGPQARESYIFVGDDGRTPPDERDILRYEVRPILPGEIDACQDYLFRQLELIQPRVVCTLGNFATKLLRGDPATGITRLHGREEARRIGPRRVRLYPIYHHAAALYTPKMLEVLREDFQRLPGLLALDPPEQPEPEPALLVPEVVEEVEREPEPAAQLGLF